MNDRGDLKPVLRPEVVETIARRVAELLGRHAITGVELVDAAELARRLGIERSWVYTHAIELGAVKLGSGRRPRLRFDPQLAVERIRARAVQDGAAEARHRPRHPRPAEGTGRPRLLPIKGGGAN
jgi:hypothetical protein